VLFENNPYIAKLTVKDHNGLPPVGSEEWQVWTANRRNEYARFIHMSHAVEVQLAFVKAQVQFWAGDSVRRKLADKSYLEHAHDIADVPYDFEIGPRMWPTEEEQEKALDTKRKIGPKVIGWCISGSRIDKVWPPSVVTVARLLREIGVPIIMFGGHGKDFETAKQIMEGVNKFNASIANLGLAISPDPDNPTWPMRRSIAQMMTCDLMIGPDTGGMWSVATMDMPKIVLLSHASPTNITTHWKNTTTLHAKPERVPCWPCHKLHDSIETCVPNKDNSGAACISDITAEQVVQTVKYLLDDPPAIESNEEFLPVVEGVEPWPV
jgi:ADP-heptose:LPS heptosyltransferase